MRLLDRIISSISDSNSPVGPSNDRKVMRSNQQNRLKAMQILSSQPTSSSTFTLINAVQLLALLICSVGVRCAELGDAAATTKASEVPHDIDTRTVVVDPYTGEALDISQLIGYDELDRLLPPGMHVESNGLVGMLDEGEAMSAAKRAPQWNSLAGAFGKRAAAPQWGSLSGGWGKRAPQWNSLNGGWGKRAAQWNSLAGAFGKRAPSTWNSLNGGWGKRSADTPQPLDNSIAQPLETSVPQAQAQTASSSNAINPWDKRLGPDFKRERPHWNKLRGMWGKRSIAESELREVAAEAAASGQA